MAYVKARSLTGGAISIESKKLAAPPARFSGTRSGARTERLGTLDIPNCCWLSYQGRREVEVSCSRDGFGRPSVTPVSRPTSAPTTHPSPWSRSNSNR